MLLRRASSPAISPGSYLRLKTTVGPCIPQKTGRFSPHLLQLVRKDVRKCRIARSYRYFRTSSLELSRKRSDTRVSPGYRSAAGSPPRPPLRRRVAASAAAPLPSRRPDHCPASPPRRLMSRFAAPSSLSTTPRCGLSVVYSRALVRLRRPRPHPVCPLVPAIAPPSLVRPLSPRHFLAALLPLNTRDRVSARCSCQAFRHPGCSHIDRGS